eukprot:Nk52_evm3s282 gene=Nk52_evmTU3s282
MDWNHGGSSQSSPGDSSDEEEEEENELHEDVDDLYTFLNLVAMAASALVKEVRPVFCTWEDFSDEHGVLHSSSKGKSSTV